MQDTIETFPSQESELKHKFNAILDSRLTVDTIDTYIEKTIQNLIEIVDEAVRIYMMEYPGTIETGKELEDKALLHFGLTSVEKYLTTAQEKADAINKSEEFIQHKVEYTGEVISPTEKDTEGTMNLNGTGGGTYEKPGIKNRLKTLLYILQERNIDLSSIAMKQGAVTEDMMRKLPYVTISIPSINRAVQICNEEGNASYVFVLDQIDSEKIDRMTKQEKEALILSKPGIGARLIQSQNWISKIEEFLFLDITIDEEETDKKKLEELPHASYFELDEWKGFYADEEGKHWGPIRTISDKLDVDYKVIVKKIKDRGLEVKKMRDSQGRPADGYNFELLAELFKELLETPDVEKTGEWKGFYTDDEGKHWGPVGTISHYLDASTFLIKNDLISSNAATKKIIDLSGRRIDGYTLESAKELLQGITKYPEVEKTGEWKGFYTDDEGKHWGAIGTIATRLGLSFFIIKNKAAGLEAKQIRDLTRRETEGYCFEVIKEKTADFIMIPEVEKTGEWKGFYTDVEGKHWAPLRTIADALKINDMTISKKIKPLQMEIKKVRDMTGRQMDGYCFELIEEQFKEFLQIPEVEKTGEWKGFYTDEKGKHLGAVKTIANKLKIDSKTVMKKIKMLNLEVKKIRDTEGRKTDGYNFEDILSQFK